jgi:hypothetical protein
MPDCRVFGVWVYALSLHSDEGVIASKDEFAASLISHWFRPQRVAVNVV